MNKPAEGRRDPYEIHHTTRGEIEDLGYFCYHEQASVQGHDRRVGNVRIWPTDQRSVVIKCNVTTDERGREFRVEFTRADLLMMLGRIDEFMEGRNEKRLDHK